MPSAAFGLGIQDEISSLRYIKWDEKFTHEKPYVLFTDAQCKSPSSNFTYEPRNEEIIRDMRGIDKEFSLDDHGFVMRNHNLSSFGFDKHTVERDYLPSAKHLLHQEFGPEAECIIFDWRLRSSDGRKTANDFVSDVNPADISFFHAPVHGVHVDLSEAGAKTHAMYSFRKGEKDLSKKRLRVVNIWRPLSYTVEDYPLALCDGSTVCPRDLVASDIISNGYRGESLQPLFRDHYQWYFLSNQTKDEVLFIKMYDSSPSAKAICCPHTSFKQKHAPISAKPRESIEVRAIIISDP
ncbi:putative 7 alpha-cephem-methoxylase [Halenospora varia]|nr:putative 7 alpha-cephem-methoxylase [Halenospora varia]